MKVALVRAALTSIFIAGGLQSARAVAPAGYGSGPLQRASSQTPQLSETLTASPLYAAKPLRQEVALANSPQRDRAWQTFQRTVGTGWHAMWDRATGAPMRIWGPGVVVPGAVANANLAERAACNFITQHLNLIAPGASASDFVLVSNHLDGDPAIATTMRTVGFVQTHRGMRVVGGQVSVRIKADRIFVVGNESFAGIALPASKLNQRKLSNAEVADKVVAQVVNNSAQFSLATAVAVEDQVVLPLVGDDSVQGYVQVTPVRMNLGGVNVLAYGDSAGELVASVVTDRNVVGSVFVNTVERNPMRQRKLVAAPLLNITLAGAPGLTSKQGEFTLTGQATVGVTATGALIEVRNAGGDAVLADLPIAGNGQAVWDESAAADRDSQLQTYIHLNIAKEYVRTFAPALGYLDQTLRANVNINQQCNANFDGNSVNFFASSMRCENTGLLSDVIYHEFGHAMHINSIIEGVGRFDGAMSEGASDFLAASITNDPGMGRGFFRDDTALRDLDPADREAIWPRDIGPIHKTGIIFGGTFWDLRKALIEQLGEATAVPLMNRLFYAAVQRASNIPTTLVEVLAADDDDGNLANGTPHECTIRDAFGKHGLRTVIGGTSAPGAFIAAAGETAKPIAIQLDGLATNCASDTISSVKVFWKGRGGVPEPGNIDAVVVTAPANGRAQYSALLPFAPNNIVDFKVEVGFASNTFVVLPDNLADGLYQMYEGKTLPLYCTDFERDPFAEGWSQILTSGAVPFEWGNPATAAQRATTDPPSAFAGANILAQGLGKDYTPKSNSILKMPVIDVGSYSNVRLQFRRWLGVEDGHFDQARINANTTNVWTNFDSNQGDNSTTSHIDREWRFTDVQLTGKFRGSEVEVSFTLTSDAGLHLSGWQLDDLCVVADPTSICGDGVQSPTEQCDDGDANADVADRCRTDCFVPACGDGIVDEQEECDFGDAEQKACDPECKFSATVAGGGLCQSGSTSPLGLFAVLLGAVLLRRRRH